MSEVNVAALNALEGFAPARNTHKECLIQKIINRYPEAHQEQVTNILENTKGFTAAAALKIVRQTGIKEGSIDTLKRHRRKECICYI